MAQTKPPSTVMQAFRYEQRRAAMFDRGGPMCLCDLCGENLATDYHEIFNRGRSIHNDDARIKSYSRYICSLLCNRCHIGVNVHRPEYATKLLEVLIVMYSYDVVKQAWDAVEAASSAPSGIMFPEKDEL